MKHVGTYLGTPLDALLAALELGLLGLAFLEFNVVKPGLEDTKGVLPVVLLGPGLGILDHDSGRDMPYADSCLDLVHILSSVAS